MQAFDLEIGQQFCCVDAASQSIENSLPIAGTSSAKKWAPLGRSFPAVVILLAQHGGLSVKLRAGQQTQWALWRAEGLCWAWGGRKGQHCPEISATDSGCGSKQGVCVLSARDVFRGDETGCYAEGWNCLGEKKTQGCLSCKELFLAVSCFQNG